MQLPEVLLWQALRGAKTGIKFRRQHPVGPYVVDFFAREPLLIIEVDGEAHERGNRPERDELRDRFLNENGYRVMRVRAVDVLRDLGAVVSSIISLAERPLHHASHGPPPRSGEE
ncbi:MULTISPECIES: endonuclease domain-containing protein [unclassified Sphingomonas]|nr:MULTISPECIES: endonuclease domain-containing protein [unclassified Sphingomonas]